MIIFFSAVSFIAGYITHTSAYNLQKEVCTKFEPLKESSIEGYTVYSICADNRRLEWIKQGNYMFASVFSILILFVSLKIDYLWKRI